MFKDVREFWADHEIPVNPAKLKSWYERFQRNYPEAISVEDEMDADSESNEGKTKAKKKPNLAEIRGWLLYKRIAERFTDYEGVMLTPT